MPWRKKTVPQYSGTCKCSVMHILKHTHTLLVGHIDNAHPQTYPYTIGLTKPSLSTSFYHYYAYNEGSGYRSAWNNMVQIEG